MAFSVYDASAFYAGIPFAVQEEGYTTSLVFDEIKHIKKNHGALDVLLETGRLKILDPEQQNVDEITKAAKKTGDFQKMSVQDISAVALCYQIGGQIVTDDFSVSNIAKNLNLHVHPIMTKGIKDVGRWIYYCPGCAKEFSKITTCPVCGSTLNRKLLKGKPL